MNTNKMIFVFGSNEAGIHGAGAALFALKNRGAIYGRSYGHYGQSFAIPTKDEIIETMPLDRIKSYVEGFIAYARGHRKMTFQVTAIGCGLAGFRHETIAPLFELAPANCYFDGIWSEYLPGKNFWGSFE